MPLLAGTFFVVSGSFSLFRAKALRDESLEGAAFSRRWLEHPSYVSSLRIMGTIAIVVGVGLLYLLLTQPSVPASR
jgi:hypothetical protein